MFIGCYMLFMKYVLQKQMKIENHNRFPYMHLSI